MLSMSATRNLTRNLQVTGATCEYQSHGPDGAPRREPDDFNGSQVLEQAPAGSLGHAAQEAGGRQGSPPAAQAAAGAAALSSGQPQA